MQKYGELSRENIEYLNKSKIKCLCLGTRENNGEVRCFELEDGNFIFPLYGQCPTWKIPQNDNQHIFVNPCYLIKKNKVRPTGGQCWPSYPNSLHVGNAMLRNYCN